MAENNNNGGESNANGEDSEIFKRAKSAEEALKLEKEEKARIAQELADLKAKGQSNAQVDTKTIDERLNKFEATQTEQIISSRTVDLANNLGIDQALAKQILNSFGGDLQKALDESRKDGTMFNLAIKQAQHKQKMSKNTPNAGSTFTGGTYEVEGKKKNFFELPPDQQKQSYKDEVRRSME